MSTGRNIRIALTLLALASNLRAESRVWTSRTGNTLEAEYAGREGGRVLLRRADGKTLGIAATDLSDEDQAYLRGLQPAAGAPAAATPTVASVTPTNRMSLGGVDIKPGDMITFLAPLPAEALKELKKEHNTIISNALVGVAVPEDFDPAKAHRVLVVSATSDANSQSIGHARQFMKEALARGWIVMAADPPDAQEPKDQSNMWRWGLIRAGLEEMHRAWPGSRGWAYATGGFSGGAKRSGYIGALLAADDYELIGMYMGGCNQDMASDGLQKYGPKRSAFLRVPCFLSNGTEDKISTIQHAQHVRDSLRSTGFKNVRLETFAGGHDPYPPHTDLALGWFEELAAERPKP